MKTIRNIFKIFRGDISRIITNPAAALIVSGLMFIPALYAWFNIAAGWDPYANTNGLKVAVVNEDKGASIDDIFETDIDDTSINIGEMVMDELRKNDQIGWQFVESEDAMDGVESGKYYAAVVLPEDFSEKLSSVLTSNVERPVLRYYVNEKKNAVATKITNAGVQAVQKQINETFISSSSLVIGKVLNKYSDIWSEHKETARADSIENISKAQEDVRQLLDTVQLLKSTLETTDSLNAALKNNLPDTKKLITSGQGTADEAQNLTRALRGLPDILTEGIETALDDLETARSEAEDVADTLDDLGDGAAALTGPTANKAGQALEAGIAQGKKVSRLLERVNQMLPVPLNSVTELKRQVDDLVKRQTRALNALKKIQSAANDARDIPANLSADLDDALANLSDTTENTHQYYLDEVQKPLYDSLDKTTDTLAAVSGSLESLDGVVGQLDTTLDSVSDASHSMIASLESTQQMLNRILDGFDDLTGRVNDLADSEKLNRALEIMENDPDQFSDFMKTPADMETIEVYPVATYGSAMTPFYSVLAIWVGGLLMVSLLKCGVEKERAKGFTSNELYFGRYMLFFSVGIIQAVIVALGDLYMLHAQCLYPGRFIFASIVSSVIFTSLIYAFTTSFGDVGKAVLVVFMVLQVAGSGGTFPIQVTPKFFQVLNPFLPFTHLINVMRECVGGLYGNDYWRYMGYALIYIPVALFVGLVLRRKAEKLNEWLEEKLSETGFM